MKIALACPGMDHIRRGYEVSLRELFEKLKHDPHYHLYKGTGASAVRETALPCLTRNAAGYRLAPYVRPYRRYQMECVTFGLSLLPHLLHEDYDVLYFADQLLGDFLLRVRTTLPLRTRFLFANGAPLPPEYCRRYDAIQQKVPIQHEKGIAAGLERRRSFLVPNGFEDPQQQIPRDFDLKLYRRNHGWPENKMVVLCVAALNFHPKRIDWLIQEFSKLDPEHYYLVMAGQVEEETRSLRVLARNLLKANSYQFTSVSPKEIPYHFAAASIMVLCSLDEGFGRAICEAMGSSCPLLVHPHPGARSIVDQEACYVDMTEPNALAKRIQSLSHDPHECELIAQKNLRRFHETYSWTQVLPQYQQMFESAINLPLMSES